MKPIVKIVMALLIPLLILWLWGVPMVMLLPISVGAVLMWFLIFVDVIFPGGKKDGKVSK